MDDALLVRRLERARDLQRNRHRFVQRERAPGDAIGERRSFDQLEHERGASRLFLDAIDRGDMWMVERCQELRLAVETRQPLGIAADRYRQQLERDLAVQPSVASAVDLAHAAAAEQRHDLEGADSGARGGQARAAYLNKVPRVLTGH